MDNDLVVSAEFRAWLRSAGPDEWHQVARSWNWDYGTEHLRWIAEQTDCDIGTALLIFWLSAPTYNLRMLNPYRAKRERNKVSIDLETIGLQILILRRWVMHDFTRSEIAFDGEALPDCELEDCAPIVPLATIKEMATPRPGRTIPRGEFTEGIPAHFERQWMEANRNRAV